jgi:hypothetical protein
VVIATVPLSQGQVAVIDASDASLVAGYRWYASPNRMGGYYATARVSGTKTTLYMHRIITGARGRSQVVDHLNHDTLDNRRANLSLGTQADNMRNSKWAHATHCPEGHPYSTQNTRINARGHRKCRICHRASEHDRRIRVGLTPAQKERKLELQRIRRHRQVA